MAISQEPLDLARNEPTPEQKLGAGGLWLGVVVSCFLCLTDPEKKYCTFLFSLLLGLSVTAIIVAVRAEHRHASFGWVVVKSSYVLAFFPLVFALFDQGKNGGLRVGFLGLVVGVSTGALLAWLWVPATRARVARVWILIQFSLAAAGGLQFFPNLLKQPSQGDSEKRAAEQELREVYGAWRQKIGRFPGQRLELRKGGIFSVQHGQRIWHGFFSPIFRDQDRVVLRFSQTKSQGHDFTLLFEHDRLTLLNNGGEDFLDLRGEWTRQE